MKQFTLLALAVLTLALICSCNRAVETDENPAKTIVTGKIINRDVYPEYNTVTVSLGDFRGQKIQYVDTIKDDGSFRVEFDLFITQDVGFHPIVSTFLARPGDSIYIDIDFKNIGYVAFSGDFAKANHDYHKYVNSNYALDYYQNTRNLTDEASYFMFCDSVKDVMHAKLAEYIKVIQPEKEVIQWAGKSVAIQHSIAIMNYVLGQVSRGYDREEAWEIPQEYASVMNNIEDLFTDSLITSSAYQLIHMLGAKKSWKHFSDSTLTNEMAIHNMLNEIAQTYSNDVFKQLLMGASFQMDLLYNNVDFFENNAQYFSTHITQPFISAPLAMHHAYVKYHIENPQIRHNEILSRLADTPGRILLDSILNAHKGKLIYIDFWATWCGPCIQALPKANRMIQHFEGENIEFVFLCMGVVKDEWEHHLTSIDMQGSHHYSENREEINTLMRGIQIRGIPFYALVNQEGYITDAGNYLRPMTPQTLSKINYWLEKTPPPL